MSEREAGPQVAARVAKNTMAQIVAMGSTIVSKLLITIVIARVFGPSAVGDFAFVITFTTLFAFLVTAGLPVALIREIATHREQVDRYAGNSMSIASIAGVGTVPLMWAIAALLGKPVEVQWAVLLAGLALACDGLAQVLTGVFNGFERMEWAAVVTITQELTFLVVGTVVLLLRLPFICIYAVYLPARLSGLLVGLAIYRKLFGRRLRFRFERPFVRELLRLSFPFAVNMALGPVYLRIDVVMLSFFQSNAVVGLYEAATSLFYRLNVFARMFNNALMPLMAREFETQAERLRTTVRAAARYQFAFGLPLTIWGVALADRLIILLFGESFAGSVIVFQLMAPLIVVRFLSNTTATTLTAAGHQATRSIIIAVLAAFNIGVNLVVLPRYSYLGATVTSIITELLFFGATYLALRRSLSRPMGAGFVVRPAIAGLAMAAVVWLLRGVVAAQPALPDGGTVSIQALPAVGGALVGLLDWLFSALPLLAVMAVSGVLYLVVLFALGTFSARERRWLLRFSQLYRLLPARARSAVLQETDRQPANPGVASIHHGE